MRAIPERLRGAFTTRRYTNPRLPLPGGLDLLVHFQYLDIVLSSAITHYLFCHNDGWLLHTKILSCRDYAFFQVHKNLK